VQAGALTSATTDLLDIVAAVLVAPIVLAVAARQRARAYRSSGVDRPPATPPW
jgi:hypothetical protein